MPFLNAGGHRLEYAWIGPAPEAAPTLVFLHEGLGCVAMWRDFPAQAAEATGLGALVYSRWGYGASDPIDEPRPVRYMHDEGLQVLPEVLAATGARDAILVGHSDGGSISLVYAGSDRTDRAAPSDAPRLRGVITMAAHVFNEDISVRSIRAARKAYRSTELPQKLARYHGDNTEGAFWGWNDVWLHPDFLAWNIEEYLPGVDCPVLAIQGEQDEYGTLAQVDAILAGVSGPASKLILPECGHSPQRDQPAATLTAIAAFAATALEADMGEMRAS